MGKRDVLDYSPPEPSNRDPRYFVSPRKLLIIVITIAIAVELFIRLLHVNA
jgi:hypothetical protein